MKKSAQIALLAAGVFTVTGLLAVGQAQTKPEVTMVLDWFVEPPHGGFYAAVQDGHHGQGHTATRRSRRALRG